MTKIGGLDERFGLGSSMMTTSPSGHGGPGLSWPSPMTCSCTTSAAGHSRATASMPKSCWMTMPGGSPPSGDWLGPMAARVALTPFTANPPMDRREEFRPQITQINADSDLNFAIPGDLSNQSEPVINSRSNSRIVPPVESPISYLRKSAKSVDRSPPVGISEAGAADRRARVSLTMIVRDEEKNLSACLQSVRRGVR